MFENAGTFRCTLLVLCPVGFGLLLGNKAERGHRAFVLVDLAVVADRLDLCLNVLQLLLIRFIIRKAVVLGLRREGEKLFEALELLLLHLGVLF